MAPAGFGILRLQTFGLEFLTPHDLDRALAYLASYGITRVERLLTDNAWAYRHSLRQICAEHLVRQKFIKPHCPWQNGKVCEDLAWRCIGPV